MRKLFTTALLLFAWVCIVFTPVNRAEAQVSAVNTQTAAALQTKLDALIAQYSLKGLQASVIIPGEGTWNGVGGVSHAGVPIDTAMVFGLGSITKTIVATTVLDLVQDSLLSLSDSIHKWLPNSYPNVNPNVTVKQLLQHRSGLFNYTENPAWGAAINNNLGATWSAEQILSNYILAPYSAPNITFRYCNTNFLLLGRIIEEATDSAWWDVVRYRLLEPNQLQGMFAVHREVATGSFPHNWLFQSSTGNVIDLYNFPKTASWTASDAAGIMASNSYDLARFGQALFQGHILQDSSLQLMRQFLPVSGGIFSGYGLGLMRFGSGNNQAWGHNGIITGFYSCLMYSPADSIVVCILSNKTSDPTNLAWALLNTARQQLINSASEQAESLTDALVCFPNPMQQKGTVQYTLRQAQPVEISLQNSLGQTVKMLLSQIQPAGDHSLTIDAGTLPSGMYFCTLQTTAGKLVRRWVIAR